MEIFEQLYEPTTPADAIEAGVAFVHQELNLFSNLTVAENMFIESFPEVFPGKINYKKIKEYTLKCIQDYGLPVTPDTKIEILPTGVRQMIEISKGLMKNPKIMIFDEPTTSLSSREKLKLFSTINELKNKGITVIYISHILEDVFELCDRIAVLRDGNLIGTDDKKMLTQSQVIRMMVGREMNQIYPTIEKTIEDRIVFEARSVCYSDKVKDVSIQLRHGEIVGLYGLMGAGRTELVKVIFGVEKMDSGRIYVNGKMIKNVTPQKCIEQHMAFVTEDRHHEGLMLTKPVAENLILVTLPKILEKLGVVNIRRQRELNNRIIEELNIKVINNEQQNAGNLSGGNQQKVVFGKWVMNEPNIFILDEPTRGVDVGAKFEIYAIIAEMAKKGSTILIISSEMEELMGICDKIMVMRDGSISGIVNKSEYHQETIVKLAL
jgi:ribose transport system ATP-binding protein